MSDNEQRNENRETVSDIVAEMRERADAMQTHGTTHGVRLAVLEFARRIEAAWKREREEVEADALEVGGIVEAARTAEKSSAVGNAAAMREALVTILAEVERFYTNDWIPYYAWETCDGLVKRALSAPARNCDFYDNKTDAETRFVEETGENDMAQHYWKMFAIWLLAPAADRQGENDGR